MNDEGPAGEARNGRLSRRPAGAPRTTRWRSRGVVRLALRYWLPLVAWCATVLALGGLAGGSVRLPATIGPVPLDKALHFVEYGVLGGLALRVFARGFGGRLTRVEALLATGLACLCIGSLDEARQYGVLGRSLDLGDLAADLLGAAVAAGAYACLRLRRGREAQGPPNIYSPQS